MFLVNHSLALPLSHVPKNCTWVSVYLTPSRPCSLSHHSIPATNVLYTSRSELPEFLHGGLYSVLSMRGLNHQGCLPNSLLMCCVPCTLLYHGNHDPYWIYQSSLCFWQLIPFGTIACTSWVIRSCNSLYVTHVLSLAYLCLSAALGVLGCLSEFLLNPALSILWIFSRVHLAELACLSAWSITSCD